MSVYQIDFSAVASGKRIASTKRRIRWRFGWANHSALEAGQTGTAARGEEHDVTIIWSVTSGKRQVLCDGREVHFSTNRSGVLDFSWPMRGSHTVKVVAHATAPLTATPGFRQYDLYVDGQSFFSMPKVYELGLRGSAPPAGSRMPPQRSLSAQEDADLQRAIRESLEDSRTPPSYAAAPVSARSLPSQAAPAPPPDMLGFAGPPPTQPALQALPAPPVPQAPVTVPAAPYGAPAPVVTPTNGYPAPVPMDSPTVITAPPTPQTPAYGGPPYGADAGSYAAAPSVVPTTDSLVQPLPPADDPFAPKAPPPPTHTDITSAILGAYEPMSAPPQGVPVTPDGSSQTLQLENGPAEPVQQLSMVTSNLEEDMNAEPQSEVDRALKNLVNFDDISAPAEKEMELTMKQKEEKNAKSNKSKAIPPKAVWGAATLGQMQEKSPAASKKNPEDIMKPPPQLFSPGAMNAGALVVYGQGPPPLQQQSVGQVGHGFGVGAQMAYAAQQQQYQYQQPGVYAAPPPPQYGYANY